MKVTCVFANAHLSSINRVKVFSLCTTNCKNMIPEVSGRLSMQITLLVVQRLLGVLKSPVRMVRSGHYPTIHKGQQIIGESVFFSKRPSCLQRYYCEGSYLCVSNKQGKPNCLQFRYRVHRSHLYPLLNS